MKTKILFNDQTAPQTPVTRDLVAEEMCPLVQKDPRIRSIRIKLLKLPHSGNGDVFRVQAKLKGQGPTIVASARSVRVRGAVKMLRRRMSRRMVRQRTIGASPSTGV